MPTAGTERPVSRPVLPPAPPGWERAPNGEREVTGRANGSGRNQQAGSTGHLGPLKPRVRPSPGVEQWEGLGPGQGGTLEPGRRWLGRQLAEDHHTLTPGIPAPLTSRSTPTWVTLAVPGSSANPSPSPPPSPLTPAMPSLPFLRSELTEPSLSCPGAPRSHGPQVISDCTAPIHGHTGWRSLKLSLIAHLLVLKAYWGHLCPAPLTCALSPSPMPSTPHLSPGRTRPPLIMSKSVSLGTVTSTAPHTMVTGLPVCTAPLHARCTPIPDLFAGEGEGRGRMQDSPAPERTRVPTRGS